MAAVKPKKRKRSILVAILVIAVLFYFAATFVNLRGEIKEREAANAELQKQYEAQLEENTQLQNYIDSGDEADYIERIAREEYGYAKPDERVYYDSTAS